VSAVAGGKHAITARYGTDPNHTASDATYALKVRFATTATALTCHPLSTLLGRAVSCVATVTDTLSGHVTPTGVVRLRTSAHGRFGHAAALRHRGSCRLSPTRAVGVASCKLKYTPLTVASGIDRLTARYPGDAAHSASRGSTLLAVTARRTR
jgi:hypothetical protein